MSNFRILSLYLENYRKTKDLRPFGEILQCSKIYYKYLTPEDKKADGTLFVTEPIQMEMYIKKNNIQEYEKVDFFVVLILVQFVVLKFCLDLYNLDETK